jgi:hypothetical protein
MRALALLLVAGCGLDEPTGAPQTWPPPLGMAVEAMVSGDLDGDGISEIVAYSSGKAAQPGLYLVEGDSALAATGVPSAFQTYAMLPLTSPSAGALAQGKLWAAYANGAAIELAELDAHLQPVDDHATALAPGGTVLWIAPVVSALGVIDAGGVIVGNGSAITFVTGVGAEIALPPPIGAPVVLAATYVDSGSVWIVVANATDAQYARLSNAGVTGAWMSGRSGAAWIGQTAVDLDGDGVPEIVGYDPATHAVCAFELSFDTVTCVPTNDTSALADATIVVGDFTGTSAADIAVVLAGPSTVDVVLVADVTFSSSTLAGTGHGTVGAALPVPAAHAFALARGAARKQGLGLAAHAGQIVCALCD